MNGRKRKIITQDVLKRREHATFLKRIRLERGFTQEEIAKGVCTVSYYSRIENNQVDVSEDYLVLLFKKFDIDYYTLKEEKTHEVFIDVLKNVLLCKRDECILIIENALSKEFYCQTEYELMMLFDAINKNLFNEVYFQIREIDSKYDTLLEYEAIFFLYLISFYYYKCSKGILAIKQIHVLLTTEHIEPLYKYAIIDLALEIYFATGTYNLFFKYYNELLVDDFLTTYQQAALRHKAQYLYLIGFENNIDCYNKIKEISDNCSSDNKEEIDWILFMLSSNIYPIEEQISFLRAMNKTHRTLSAEALLLLKLDNKKLYKEFLERVSNYYFDPTYSCYEGICSVVKRIKKNDDLINTYILLKEHVNQLVDQTFDYYFLNILKLLTIEVAQMVSRYKDCISFIIDIEDRLKKIK